MISETSLNKQYNHTLIIIRNKNYKLKENKTTTKYNCYNLQNFILVLKF